MFKSFIFVLLIGFPILSFGQFVPAQGDDLIVVTPNSTPRRAIVKVSLLSPLELAKSVRVSLEVTLDQHFTLEPEIGYIYSYNVNANKLNNNLLNAEQRLALRYYIPEDFINGLYVAPLATFSSINFQKGTWRNLVPNQPDSAWFLDYANAGQYQLINIGVYAIAGIQTVLLKHFVLDFNGGFGARYSSTITKFSPLISRGETVPGPVNNILTEGLFSVHLGYVF